MKGSQIIAEVVGKNRGSSKGQLDKMSPAVYDDSWDDRINRDGTDYMGKSFAEHVIEYPVIVDGMQFSDMLTDVVKSLSDTLEAFESRVNDQIDRVFEDSADFDSYLGESVLAIGKSIHHVNQRVVELEDTQKSMSPLHFNGEILNKGGFSESNNFSKDEMMNLLIKGVQQGIVDPLEVTKYELTDQVAENVIKSLSGLEA